MLVQYPYGRPRKICQIVPDNMVVLYQGTLRVTTNFGLEVQPCGPFWVLEYVSKGSQRKDYEESFHKYERQLKFPYYLIFYPDNQELTLYHLRNNRYRAIVPDSNDRRAIPEVEMEVGLLNGWARFWYKGDLLPLPAEMANRLNTVTRERDTLARERDALARERDRAIHKNQEMAQELARLRAQLGLPAE